MKIALVCPYDFAYPGGVANHIRSLEHRLTEVGNKVKVREIWNRVSPQ